MAGDRLPPRHRERSSTAPVPDLGAVSGDELLRLWEDAFGQVRGVVPVLAHTVDELDRHVQDRRTADVLFPQVSDREPDPPER